MESGSIIEAKSTNPNDPGGHIVLFADEHLSVYGTINAQGGSSSWIETSSRNGLVVTGQVYAGENGTWLIDPTTLTIATSDSGSDSTNTIISTSTLSQATGNIIYEATDSITVSAWPSSLDNSLNSITLKSDTVSIGTSINTFGKALKFLMNPLESNSTSTITTNNNSISGSGAVTIENSSGSKPVTLSGNLTTNSDLTISAPLQLGSATTITSNNNAITISGDITGHYNLTLNAGSDNLTLANIGTSNQSIGTLSLTTNSLSSAGNWYTGNISGNSNLTTSGALTVNSGSIDLNNISLGGKLTITSNSTIVLGNITNASGNKALELIAGSNSNITLGSLGTSSSNLGAVDFTTQGSGTITTDASTWHTGTISGSPAFSNTASLTISASGVSLRSKYGQQLICKHTDIKRADYSG